MEKDDNISPKVAPTVYSIMRQLERMGLTEDDLITLIQRRIKGSPKITREMVQKTLEALKQIEKNFLEASGLKEYKEL